MTATGTGATEQEASYCASAPAIEQSEQRARRTPVDLLDDSMCFQELSSFRTFQDLRGRGNSFHPIGCSPNQDFPDIPKFQSFIDSILDGTSDQKCRCAGRSHVSSHEYSQ